MVRGQRLKRLPLFKWSRLVMPKELEGWGIKKLVWFCKYLVAKILWRLIQNKMIWGKVVTSKYLAGKSLVEWWQSPKKISTSSLIGWRVMEKASDLVIKWLVWQVENGKSIQIKEDPCVNLGLGFKISRELLSKLHDQEILSLWDAILEGGDLFGRTLWKTDDMLELEGNLAEEWRSYVDLLTSNFINLQ
jgi:hypothetical protein